MSTIAFRPINVLFVATTVNVITAAVGSFVKWFAVVGAAVIFATG